MVNGVPVRLLAGGSGPPLVYLHGALPAGEWLPLINRLAERRTVYVPDHPGFGHTPRPEWLEGMDDVVLHYEELFRGLGLERPALVGFSLGGWIAAAFSVVYPQRVRALVLHNAAGLHVDGALIPDLMGQPPDAMGPLLFRSAAAASAFFGGRLDPEERLRRLRALTTTALLAWNPWFDPRLLRRLRRISCPALALWSAEDRLIPPVYGEAYCGAIPGARLELLPGCAHMAPLEDGEVVAAAVLRFLAESGC